MPGLLSSASVAMKAYGFPPPDIGTIQMSDLVLPPGAFDSTARKRPSGDQALGTARRPSRKKTRSSLPPAAGTTQTLVARPSSFA